MLIRSGFHVFNTDHIVSADGSTRRPDGSTLWRVTLTTGKTINIEDHDAQLDEICGTIVPAPPGLTLVEAYLPEGTDAGSPIFYRQSAVIAFRLPERNDAPIPIGALGEPTASAGQDYAVLQLSGQCVGWEETWDTLGDFEAHCERMRARRGAKP